MDILLDIGPIIGVVRLALLDQICVNISWIPRDTNKVARNLVHYAKTINFDECLWSSPLNFVKQIMLYVFPTTILINLAFIPN